MDDPRRDAPAPERPTNGDREGPGDRATAHAPVARREGVAAAAAVGGLAVAYLLAMELGLRLRVMPEGIAAAWPAAGIAAAGLVLGWRHRLWLASALALATLGLNLAHGQPLAAALVFALVNPAEALLFAWLVRRRWPESATPLESLRATGLFALAAVIATVAAASAGAALLRTLADEGGDWLRLVRVWALADLVGIVAVAPAVLTAARRDVWTRVRPASVFEGFAALALIALAARYVFAELAPGGEPWLAQAGAALLIALVLLVTVRLPPVYATTALPVVLAIAVLALLVGERPATVGAVALDRVQSLQAFVFLLAVMVLSLGALMRQRLRAERQLRASEQLFRAAVENFPHGFVLYDGERRFRFLNTWARHLLDRHPTDYLGRRDEDLWPPALTDVYLPALERAIRTGEVESFEWTLPPEFGEKTLAITYVPLRDDRGRTTQVIAITLDLTERKRAEARLQEADRAKDEFIATLAHELRNPLAPIRSGLRVIELAGDDRARVQEVRAMMQRQVGHLVHLVDDLLDVARITRGRLELRVRRLDLAEAIGSAVDAARPALDAAGHAFSLRLPPEPLPVDGDPTRLAQVFGNLLSNAARYTPPGGRVSLVAERRGEEAVVTVADDGVGIAPDALERIFAMFVQVGHDAEHGASGLGIGLGLVRALVERHGGTVSAASEGPGRGATFTVRLPLVAAGSSADGTVDGAAA